MSGAAIGTAAANYGAGGVGGVSGGAPLVFDVGARIAKYVYVGGFFQYTFLTESCYVPTDYRGATASCSGHDMRGGVDVQVHIRPRQSVDPWVGLGIGHEWLSTSAVESYAGSSSTYSVQFDGWNFADLMAGVDFRSSNGLAFGPYLEFSSGSFGSYNASVKGADANSSTSSTSGDIPSQSAHQWFTLGARGTFEML
jgi:hypothetical protein